MFAPFRSSKTAGNLQFEVVQLLSAVGVKMLVIDEVQHVLAGPMLRRRHLLNVIKYLGNELQIPIVAVGTHDAFNAIQTDPQLANRFEPARLPRWGMNDDYLRLLAGFEIALPLKNPSRLTQTSATQKTLSLSEGTIGENTSPAHPGFPHAIEHGTERITAALLERCDYISPRERRHAPTTAAS